MKVFKQAISVYRRIYISYMQTQHHISRGLKDFDVWESWNNPPCILREDYIPGFSSCMSLLLHLSPPSFCHTLCSNHIEIILFLKYNMPCFTSYPSHLSSLWANDCSFFFFISDPLISKIRPWNKVFLGALLVLNVYSYIQINKLTAIWTFSSHFLSIVKCHIF